MSIPVRSFLLGIFLWMAMCGSGQAANILVLGSGTTAYDQEVQKALQERGHTVTIGPASTDFTGAQVSLANYDATVLLYTTGSAVGMPAAGVSALLTYLYSGGRLITVEPYYWDTGNSALIRSVLPVQHIGNSNSPGATTFAQATPDSILDDGVSTTFTFTPANHGYFDAYPYATEYFTSRGRGPGLLGRVLAGGGRILSFAVSLGQVELQNSDLRRLLGNAVNWVTVPYAPSITTSNPARVLLLGSTDPDWDREVIRALKEAGNTVTAGPSVYDFTGKQVSLASFDVTLATYGVQSSAPMPPDGQTALLNYVLGGGHVITGEPFNWATGGAAIHNTFPVAHTGNFNRPNTATFAVSEADAVLNQGLPNSFTFDLSGFGYFDALAADAKQYYTGVAGSIGLAGRILGGGGRVLSFGSTIGALEVQNASFRRLLVNAVAWAKGGSGVAVSPIANPPSLSFSYVTGGSAPAAQTVAISNSAGPAVSFTVASTSSGGWLAATPTSGTTPSNLSVTVNPGTLPAGSYAGEVDVTAGGSILRIPVTLTVAAGGSSSPSCTYQISPPGASFPVSGGTGSIGIVTQSGCIWTAASNSPWLVVGSGASGSGQGTVNYTVAPSAIATARVGTITVAGQQFTVIQPGSAVSFIAGPDPLTFRFAEGSTQPSDGVVNIFTNGTGSSFTSSVSGGSWLSGTPASGTLPGSILATVNPTGLAAGVYNGSILVQVPNATPSSQTVKIQVTIDPAGPAKLVVQPTAVNLSAIQGGPPVIGKIQVLNQGSGTLVFQAAASGASWLSVQPTSGTATIAAPATLVITGDPAGMDAGTYTGRVTVTPQGGTPAGVDVFMTITASRQTILLSQSGLTFIAVAQGGTPPSQNFGILNTGSGVMQWSVAVSTLAGGSWLSTAASQGVTDSSSLTVPLVDVNVNASGLAPGEYHGLVTVTSATAGNSPQLLSVLLRVLPPGSDPGPVVRPTGLIFTASAGSPASTTQEVQVSTLTGAPRPFTSSRLTFDGGNWFTHLPVDATVMPSQPTRLLVQFNPAGLAPGIRKGVLTLLFQDGAVQTVSLLSLVASAPSTALTVKGHAQPAASSSCGTIGLQVQPTTLERDFVAVVGQATTVSVKVVDECGRNIDKTGLVTVRFSTTDPAITLASVGGGIWTGTWRPVSGAALVTLDITALYSDDNLRRGGEVLLTGTVQTTSQLPLVTSNGIVQAASSVSGVPLAPGSIVTVYGSNLSDGVAKADALPLPDRLNNMQLLLGDRSLPLFYTSAGQANAQVPFDLSPNTQHQIVVRRGTSLSVPQTLSVAEAQPGIFTVNQQGTGQGIILKSDQRTVAAPGTPANVGEAIVIYCTGLGLVTPAVTEGKPAPESSLSRTVKPVTVTIGGKDATVLFSGLTPDSAGLYQINAIVPDVTGDAVPVQIQVAGQLSPVVAMAVK